MLPNGEDAAWLWPKPARSTRARFSRADLDMASRYQTRKVGAFSPLPKEKAMAPTGRSMKLASAPANPECDCLPKLSRDGDQGARRLLKCF